MEYYFILQASERVGMFRDFFGPRKNFLVEERMKFALSDPEERVETRGNCKVYRFENWIVGWGPQEELEPIYNSSKAELQKILIK